MGLVLVPFVEMPRAKMGHVIGLSFTMGSLHFGLMFTGVAGVDAAVAAIAIQLPGAVRLDPRGDPVQGLSRLAAHARHGRRLRRHCADRRANRAWNRTCSISAWSSPPRWSFATSNIQVKAMGDAPPLGVLGWSSLFAAPQLFAISLIFEDNHWRDFQAAALTAGRGGLYDRLRRLIGYGIWYSFLRRYTVNQVMPFTLVVPVFGVLGGVWILGEQMTWQMILGSVLTVAGVAVIVLRRPATAEAPLKS